MAQEATISGQSWKCGAERGEHDVEQGRQSAVPRKCLSRPGWEETQALEHRVLEAALSTSLRLTLSGQEAVVEQALQSSC